MGINDNKDHNDTRFIPGFRPLAPIEDVDRKPLDKPVSLHDGSQPAKDRPESEPIKPTTAISPHELFPIAQTPVIPKLHTTKPK